MRLIGRHGSPHDLFFVPSPGCIEVFLCSEFKQVAAGLYHHIQSCLLLHFSILILEILQVQEPRIAFLLSGPTCWQPDPAQLMSVASILLRDPQSCRQTRP